ncbi:leishmanolysin-like peptidase, invadolysin isoform X2 [Arctopsyche grandis]|uniref:leishmanolysin-like peptidase, invadolysin isoform X2 n=1 Tax=Arctopsyche grandis TaxID=121162 RepID=UPI00406D71DA
MLNTILPQSVQFWEKTLMVRKTGDAIRLNRKCSSRQVFVKGGQTHCIGSCLSTTTCGEVHVPQEHLNPCYVCNATGHSCGIAKNADEGSTVGPGVADADFVLYVSALETERCKRGLTVAYAAHCQQESALDRPIAGHANFCPSELSTRLQDLGSMLSTVQHEMLHALGFSLSLYAFYRDDEGNPLTPRRPDTGSPPLNEELQIHQWSERVVKNITRDKWVVRGGFMVRNIQMVVTPRVVKEVREHFGCPTLEGAELEDQGGEGTALTHWEKRIMENEAMTGTHTQNPVFSRITLALMEDTGWYRADYANAKPLAWGKGLGCEFATKSCKEWINNNTFSGRSPHPFCSRVKKDPLQTECSQQRDSVALCNLIIHDKPLPPLYQHFDWIPDAEPGTESYYGGSVSLADYCPYIQEFTWRFRSVAVRGSRCSFSENNPKVDKNFALESYGENSKCFDHTNQMWEQRSCRQVRQWQHWGSGCYEYKCQSGRLHIMVGNYSYECFHAGQELAVRILRLGWLHRGSLICPPCREICHAEFEKRGEQCRGGDEAPPNNFYQRDELQCGSAIPTSRPSVSLHVIAVSISLGVMLFVTSFCMCSSTIVQAAHGVAKLTKIAKDKISSARRDNKNTNVRKLNPEARFNLEEVVVTNNEENNDAANNSPVESHVQNVVVQGHVNNHDQINDLDDPNNIVDCHFNAHEVDNAVVLHPTSQDWNEYYSDSEIQVYSMKTKRKLSRIIRCVDDYPMAIEAEKAIKEEAMKEKNKKKGSFKKSFKGKEPKKIDEEIKSVEEDVKSKRRRSKDVKKLKKDKFSDIDLDEEPGYFELDQPIILEDDDPYLQEKRPSVDSNRISKR